MIRHVAGTAWIISVVVLLGPCAFSQCEVAEIHPRDAAKLDVFGFAIASTGDQALIGAPSREREDGSGAVFAWRKLGGGWRPAQVWERGWNFGVAIDMTAERAVVGGFHLAAVYRREGPGWAFETELQGSEPPSGYGGSVAIDGDWILVGADEVQKAFVYHWNGSAWEEDTLLAPDAWSSEYGRDVDLEGDLAVVGAPSDSDLGEGAGAVWAYRHTRGGWQLEEKVRASDGGYRAYFGTCVAIEGDLLLVGAPNDREEGAAYLFRHEADAWRELTKITSPTPQHWSQFGGQVVIQGTRLAVAAPFMDSSEGRVLLYEEAGGHWVFQAVCRASDSSSQDLFGQAVAFNGDDLFVGAPYDSEAGYVAGVAYLFDVGPDVGGSRASYGGGWPGSLGVPELTVNRDPLLCSGLILRADNSRGRVTIGFLVLGTQAAEIDTPAGGTLLVAPMVIRAVGVPGVGLAWPLTVPCDPLLDGFEVDAQMIEVDPGASGGFSFSPGLQLVFGACPQVE